MAEINGFSIEKQQGAELCWAAAAKAVFDHYYPGLSPDQTVLSMRLGHVNKEAGSPEEAFRATTSLHSVESFLGDDAALGQAGRIFLKIDDHIRKGEPVVVYVQQTGGLGFRHALVIYKTDPFEKTLYLKDPGAPSLDLEVDVNTLMSSWKLYGSVIGMQYMGLFVFARRFFFTERPNRFNLLRGVGEIER